MGMRWRHLTGAPKSGASIWRLTRSLSRRILRAGDRCVNRDSRVNYTLDSRVNYSLAIDVDAARIGGAIRPVKLVWT